MSKAILESEVFMDEDPLGESSSGYMFIRCSKTLRIDRITGYIFLETRGHLASCKVELFNFNISGERTLQRDELYNIPFQYGPKHFAIDSYTGEKASFIYNCEVQIDVSPNDLPKVDRTVFSKIKSFVSSNDAIKTNKHFTIANENYKYEVVDTVEALDLRAHYLFMVIPVFLVLVTYLLVIPEYSEKYLFGGMALLGGTGLLTYHLVPEVVERILGEVLLKVSSDGDGFLCRTRKDRALAFSNQELHYEIVEVVVDRRGTDTCTYLSTVYSSESKALKRYRDESEEVRFSYPKLKGYQSISHSDVSLVWKVILTGNYKGLTFLYDAEVVIKKVRREERSSI